MSVQRIRKVPPQRPNLALRDHVTRVGFNLTLGRTHVAALVYLNESIAQGKHFHGAGRAFSHFVSGIQGCERRGLVGHHFDPNARREGREGLRPHYTITRAGELVIGLLRESGLYDEYAGALPSAEVA